MARRLAGAAALAAVAGAAWVALRAPGRLPTALVIADVTLIDGTGAPPRPHAR